MTENDTQELIPKDISGIYKQIREVLIQTRSRALQAVNTEMVACYWQIGRLIVEEEQQGDTRAEYGKRLIRDLSNRLTEEFGKGFDRTNLQHMRAFYLGYSNRDALRRDLSWTHYRLLLRLEKPEARAFYEAESVNSRWSTRELERQINSLLFERLALSRDKAGVLELAQKGHEVQQPTDLVKDPYVLEFTGIKQDERFLEKDLETALIGKLRQFLLLEPGTRISHAAVKLAATTGTLLIWVGEAGVRLYSSGQPGGARSDKLLYQAKLALDENLRLKVVRKMFEMRFGEKPPERRSVDQLRGIEGVRVKKLYQLMAQQYRVKWKGRRYNPKDWSQGDVANQCLSAATSCLYGVTEAAILAAGYAPAVGFLHSGKPLSFVYDIADIFKFETVVPVAFKIAGKNPSQPDREVRIACRDSFWQTRLLKRIIPTIEEVLATGGISPPPPPKDAQPPAIPEPENIGDEGHRSK